MSRKPQIKMTPFKTTPSTPTPKQEEIMPFEGSTEPTHRDRLHLFSWFEDVSEAESIILAAYRQLQLAEDCPRQYQIMKRWQYLQRIVGRVLDGESVERVAPEDAELAKVIAAWMERDLPAAD